MVVLAGVFHQVFIGFIIMEHLLLAYTQTNKNHQFANKLMVFICLLSVVT